MVGRIDTETRPLAGVHGALHDLRVAVDMTEEPVRDDNLTLWWCEGYCDVCGENPVLYPADDPDGFYVCEECRRDG